MFVWNPRNSNHDQIKTRLCFMQTESLLADFIYIKHKSHANGEGRCPAVLGTTDPMGDYVHMQAFVEHHGKPNLRRDQNRKTSYFFLLCRPT